EAGDGLAALVGLVVVAPAAQQHERAESEEQGAAVAEAVGPRAGAARKALVDGAAGLAWPAEGAPRLVLVFTVLEDRITAIDALADEDHLARLDLHV
ncbi:RNA polymerase subunit sigma-70, partial [Streptomyces sp. NPDC001809]